MISHVAWHIRKILRPFGFTLILSWFRLHFDRKVSWSADTFESWKIRGVFTVQYAKRETWECVLITSERASKKMQSCFSKHGVQFCIAWWADLLKRREGNKIRLWPFLPLGDHYVRQGVLSATSSPELPRFVRINAIYGKSERSLQSLKLREKKNLKKKGLQNYNFVPSW